MATITLTELIFKAKLVSLDLSFLKELIKNSKDCRFNSPLISGLFEYHDLVKIFQTNDYVDFVITTDQLHVQEKIVSNVFINIGIDNGELELLFFLDLNDLHLNPKLGIDFLRKWAEVYRTKFKFDRFLCRLDNGNENEYYFDNNKVGPLYLNLK